MSAEVAAAPAAVAAAVERMMHALGLGKAVQVGPIKPTMRAPGAKRLKL